MCPQEVPLKDSAWMMLDLWPEEVHLKDSLKWFFDSKLEVFLAESAWMLEETVVHPVPNCVHNAEKNGNTCFYGLADCAWMLEEWQTVPPSRGKRRRSRALSAI